MAGFGRSTRDSATLLGTRRHEEPICDIVSAAVTLSWLAYERDQVLQLAAGREKRVLQLVSNEVIHGCSMFSAYRSQYWACTAPYLLQWPHLFADTARRVMCE